MIVNNLGMNSGLSIQNLVDMREKLADLQRQLGTGKKADTYAGLGLDRGLTVGLRSQLSAIAGYQQAITDVGVRLDLSNTALSQIDQIVRSTKSSVMQSPFQLGASSQTVEQKSAFMQFEQLLNALNTSTGDRYLFSGRDVTQPAVALADDIMNGSGTRAGLKQIIDERRQADLGASGLGRLVVGAPTPTTAALTEDAVSPFGFKLAGIASGISGSTTSGPTGAPATASVALGSNPTAGETVSFTFTLPDGSTQSLTMTATASATPGPNEFSVGASAAATAANLRTALGQSLSTLASTSLAAASAVAAADNFFAVDDANPPQRVDGPPFDTATGLVDGTDANTVSWYLGEGGAGSARDSAVARADGALSLSYGLRANEEGLRLALQSVAVFAAVSYSSSDPNAEASYVALKQRVTATLDGVPGKQKVTDIQAEMAAVHNALAAAKERHQQTGSMLEQLLQKVEGATPEEVAAQILSLQTSLQATLQTTAMLLQTNLLQYL